MVTLCPREVRERLKLVTGGYRGPISSPAPGQDSWELLID